jgi:hypothetical protein
VAAVAVECFTQQIAVLGLDQTLLLLERAALLV